MALSNCGCQLVQMRNLLNKISFNVLTLHVYNDNLGLLFWKSNPIQEKYFKYIDIYYYYIKDLIENKQVKPYHIDGKENLANILTKNISQVLFSHFCLSLCKNTKQQTSFLFYFIFFHFHFLLIILHFSIFRTQGLWLEVISHISHISHI